MHLNFAIIGSTGINWAATWYEILLQMVLIIYNLTVFLDEEFFACCHVFMNMPYFKKALILFDCILHRVLIIDSIIVYFNAWICLMLQMLNFVGLQWNCVNVAYKGLFKFLMIGVVVNGSWIYGSGNVWDVSTLMGMTLNRFDCMLVSYDAC